MTVRMVEHPTLSDARKRQSAVDRADGYPRQGSARGHRCGPAPEGDTLHSLSIAENELTGVHYTRIRPDLEGQQEIVDGKRVVISDNGSVDVDESELKGK